MRLAHNGGILPDAYAPALTLGGEGHHLLQKAAGWLLREAGTTDMGRLERFLVKNGARFSRTTVSYAIERFPQPKRRELLAATREARPTRKPLTADAEIAENRTRSFLRVPRIPR